jgi:hypothetical protein
MLAMSFWLPSVSLAEWKYPYGPVPSQALTAYIFTLAYLSLEIHYSNEPPWYYSSEWPTG